MTKGTKTMDGDETRAGYVIWVTLITANDGGRRCRSESTWRPVASALTLRASLARTVNAEEFHRERGAGGSWTASAVQGNLAGPLSPLRHPLSVGAAPRSLYPWGLHGDPSIGGGCTEIHLSYGCPHRAPHTHRG